MRGSKDEWAAYMRVWRAKNLEKARATGRATYYRDHERRKQHLRAYQKTHKADQNRRHRQRMLDPAEREKHRRVCRYHRARQRVEKTPLVAFFEAEVRAFYDACPPGMEVDHIHPIKHDMLCGLHVPWNLQYLTGTENKRKMMADRKRMDWIDIA
jgi:hypothetical protein